MLLSKGMKKNEYIKFLVKKMADPQKIDFLSNNAKDVRVHQELPEKNINFNSTDDIITDVLSFAIKNNAIYVEGYVFQDKIMPERATEHAWIKKKNGNDYFDICKLNAQNYISVIELDPNKAAEIKQKKDIIKGGILSSLIADYCLSAKNPRKS